MSLCDPQFLESRICVCLCVCVCMCLWLSWNQYPNIQDLGSVTECRGCCTSVLTPFDVGRCDLIRSSDSQILGKLLLCFCLSHTLHLHLCHSLEWLISSGAVSHAPQAPAPAQAAVSHEVSLPCKTWVWEFCLNVVMASRCATVNFSTANFQLEMQER